MFPTARTTGSHGCFSFLCRLCCPFLLVDYALWISPRHASCSPTRRPFPRKTSSTSETPSANYCAYHPRLPAAVSSSSTVDCPRRDTPSPPITCVLSVHHTSLRNTIGLNFACALIQHKAGLNTFFNLLAHFRFACLYISKPHPPRTTWCAQSNPQKYTSRSDCSLCRFSTSGNR